MENPKFEKRESGEHGEMIKKCSGSLAQERN